MTTNKITVSIGLNDRISKTQLISTDKAIDLIEDAFLTVSDGMSITTGRGTFTHADGSKVRETSVFVTLYGVDYEAARPVIESLCVALNQESIAVELATIESEFVEVEREEV